MAEIDNNLDKESQKKYYEEKITNSGFKVTKPRDVIIEVLYSANNLLTADDVYMEVKNGMLMVNG